MIELVIYIYEVVKGRWDEAESERCAIGIAIRYLTKNVLKGFSNKKDAEVIVQRYKDYLDEVGYSDLEESYRSGKRLA